MSEHSNLQKFVVVVKAPDGETWVVGTDTQRGFTEKGVGAAQAKLEAHLPGNWLSYEEELMPLSSALVLKRK